MAAIFPPDTHAMARRPRPRAYRTAYLAALGIVAALILSGQFLSMRMLQSMEQDSHTINQSGRQRMLYLTISRACLVLSAHPEEEARQKAWRQLEQTLGQWQRVHQGLAAGDAALRLSGSGSPGAKELLGAMEPSRRAVLESAQSVLGHGHATLAPASLAETVQAQGQRYLDSMERLVLLYDQEAKARVERQMLLEWLLTGLELAGLALVGVFIFRPMARRLGQDMEELQAAARSFEELSLTDGLTGLANRRALDLRLAEEWRRAWRDSQSLALVMLDLDHFKAFNDTYGHQEGDRVLRAVANVLKASVHRQGDLAARYGGEEMVALLVGADLAGALAVAQEIRLRVEGLGLAHRASPVAPVVTVSLGVAAAWPRPGSRPQELVQAADQALYRAKAGGRNQAQAQELDLGRAAVLPGA